jgi:hypothetical protein
MEPFICFLNLVFVSIFSIFESQGSELTLWVDLGFTPGPGLNSTQKHNVKSKRICSVRGSNLRSRHQETYHKISRNFKSCSNSEVNLLICQTTVDIFFDFVINSNILNYLFHMLYHKRIPTEIQINMVNIFPAHIVLGRTSNVLKIFASKKSGLNTELIILIFIHIKMHDNPTINSKIFLPFTHLWCWICYSLHELFLNYWKQIFVYIKTGIFQIICYRCLCKAS